jgi:hypothetical protein
VVLVTDKATDRGVVESGLGAKLRAVRVIEVERTGDTAAVFTALLEAAQ